MNISDKAPDEICSDSSSNMDEADDMEVALINGSELRLPRGLCDNKQIFNDIFSIDTWNGLSEENKTHLQAFLPHFTANDDEEKCETLRSLFECETFKFTNPLVQFHEQLRAGHFQPDISRLRALLKQLREREALNRYRQYKQRLKMDVLHSYRKLVTQVRGVPPNGALPVLPNTKSNYTKYSQNLLGKTKKRYYQVLLSIHTKLDEGSLSTDENYPEGPSAPLSRKQRRSLNSIKNAFASKHRMFASTMVASSANGVDLERHVTPARNPFHINEEAYKQVMHKHRQRRRRLLNSYYYAPKMCTRGITISDVIVRTQLPATKPPPLQPPPPTEYANTSSNLKRINSSDISGVRINRRKVHRSQESLSPQPPPLPPNVFKSSKCLSKTNNPQAFNSELESDSDLFECDNSSASAVNTKPVKLKSKVTVRKPKDNHHSQMKSNETITTVDTFKEKHSLEAAKTVAMKNGSAVWLQTTHTNFLTLIRDVICSTSEDHRSSYNNLYEHLKEWQKHSISCLNVWFLQLDSWLPLLTPALNFLCGNTGETLPNDFVPYMEYKSVMGLYQWIGAGRDTDHLLSILYDFWMEHRKNGAGCGGTINGDQQKLVVATPTTTCEQNSPPPPPRCPTNWIVRKATEPEVLRFQEQERHRYSNPHRAFTYRCNGYESVVAPLKGIYNPSSTLSNSKARGHTMLTADRPNFVTILSLVRDATARLPNGEGTRGDICELLKSSQYISSAAPDTVLQSVVSGALDRMHTQFDPCVRYDSRRKIWMYLHRNRSEQDFERIHQQYQNVARTRPTRKQSTSTTSRTRTKNVKSEQNMVVVGNEQTDRKIDESEMKIASIESDCRTDWNNSSRITLGIPTNDTITTTTSIPSSATIRVTPLEVRSAPDSLQDYNIQIKSHTSLTPTQQQQIIQTIKQKLLPPNAVVNAQQVFVKQKAVSLPVAMTQQASPAMMSTTVSPPNTSRLVTCDASKSGSGLPPVIAKVLTNAAGQVISVESLLAHQKQHGSLPQGTTLRVTGAKNSSSNLLQLISPTATINTTTVLNTTQNSHNSIAIVNSQAKIVTQATQQTPTTTATKSMIAMQTAAPTLRPPTVMKNCVDIQKTDPKTYSKAAGASFVKACPTLTLTSSTAAMDSVATTTATIRMLNASNLNLTRIGGKSVLLTSSKGPTATLHTLPIGQNVLLQTHQADPTTSTTTTTNTTTTTTTTTTNAVINSVATTASSGATASLKANQASLVVGTAIKMHTTSPSVVPQITKTNPNHGDHSGQQHIVLQTSANSPQRLLMGDNSQQQQQQIVAQQILLPAGLHGTTLNIKTLQGVKVIPLSQAHSLKSGIQGRHILARVMNPNVFKTVQSSSSTAPTLVENISESTRAPPSPEKK